GGGGRAPRAVPGEHAPGAPAKPPPARNAAGGFSKDHFAVDLERGTVTGPAGKTAVITPTARGGGKASFRPWRAGYPLRPACTAARRGAHRHRPRARGGAATRPRRPA